MKYSLRFPFVLSIGLLVLSGSVHAQLQWRDRTMEAEKDLVAVAHANGLTVAVGNENAYGYIYTTDDLTAQAWTEYNLFEPATFNVVPHAVTFFNNQWLIVDSQGNAAVTTDFSSFSRNDTGTRDIANLRLWNNQVLAAGRNGLASSSNGTDWDYLEITPDTFTEFSDIAYDGTRWVMTGRSSGQGVIYTSTDGTAWTPVFSVSDGLELTYSIDYADGLFVVVGNNGLLMTSPDGMDWTIATDSPMSGTVFTVRHVDDVWIAAGTSGVWSSTDGQTFIEDDLPRVPGRAGGVYMAADAGGLRVLVGRDGKVFTEGESPEAPVFTSLPDPVRMTPGVSASLVGLSARAFPGDIEFIWNWQGEEILSNASGLGETKSSALAITVPEATTSFSVEATSSSGTANTGPIELTVVPPTDWDEWAEYTVLEEGEFFQSGMKAYGAGKYLFAYNAFPTADTPAGIVWSTDGISWNRVELSAAGTVNALAFLEDHFVATIDDGSLYYSTDGISWSGPIEIITEGSSFVKAMRYLGSINGVYFAGTWIGSETAGLYRSTDLVNWTRVNNDSLTRTRSLFSYDGALYAVQTSPSQPTTLMKTIDGSFWESSSISLPPATTINRIAIGPNRLVASGNSSDGFWVGVSEDAGSTWSLESATGKSLVVRDVQYSEGRYILGTSQTSEDGVSWVRHNLKGAASGTLLLAGGQRLVADSNRILVGGGSPLFDGATDLGNGWYDSPWLGQFNAVSSDALYHEAVGWMIFGEEAAGGGWFYLVEEALWLWLSASAHYTLAYNPADGLWYEWSGDAWVELVRSAAEAAATREPPVPSLVPRGK